MLIAANASMLWPGILETLLYLPPLEMIIDLGCVLRTRLNHCKYFANCLLSDGLKQKELKISHMQHRMGTAYDCEMEYYHDRKHFRSTDRQSYLCATSAFTNSILPEQRPFYYISAY